MWHLALQLLHNPPQVLLNGKTCTFRGAQAPAIFYYYADHWPLRLTELTLSNLLGPEANFDRITNVCYALRRGLQDAGAPPEIASHYVPRREGPQVVLRWDSYDVREFEALVRSATRETDLAPLEQARKLYDAPFLDGFYISEAAPGFDAWVRDRRAELAGAYHKLLHLLGIRYLVAGRWAEAIPCLEPLILPPAAGQDDPVDQTPAGTEKELEVIYGLLMTSYALTQRLDLAQQLYTQYVRRLGPVPGAEPPSWLKHLHRDIQAHRLADLHVYDDVAEALHRLPHTMRDPRLADIYRGICMAIGACPAPKWSEGARTVLQHARAKAARHGASLIGTPHLALALCASADAAQSASTDAARSARTDFYDSLPVPPASLAQALHVVLGGDPADCLPPEDHKTLPLRRVLSVATDLATAAGTPECDVPHLWLAVLQEQHSVFEQILERYGGHRDTVRAQLKEALEAGAW